jgi:hypothetical protein
MEQKEAVEQPLFNYLIGVTLQNIEKRIISTYNEIKGTDI